MLVRREELLAAGYEFQFARVKNGAPALHERFEHLSRGKLIEYEIATTRKAGLAMTRF